MFCPLSVGLVLICNFLFVPRNVVINLDCVKVDVDLYCRSDSPFF